MTPCYLHLPILPPGTTIFPDFPPRNRTFSQSQIDALETCIGTTEFCQLLVPDLLTVVNTHLDKHSRRSRGDLKGQENRGGQADMKGQADLKGQTDRLNTPLLSCLCKFFGAFLLKKNQPCNFSSINFQLNFISVLMTTLTTISIPVCPCSCMFACVCVCTRHICVCIHTHVCMHVNTHVCIHPKMHVWMHAPCKTLHYTTHTDK